MRVGAFYYAPELYKRHKSLITVAMRQMFTSHISGKERKIIDSYQVIIRLDAKKLSEISEC